jgi:signal transduction histidine kinase
LHLEREAREPIPDIVPRLPSGAPDSGHILALLRRASIGRLAADALANLAAVAHRAERALAAEAAHGGAAAVAAVLPEGLEELADACRELRNVADACRTLSRTHEPARRVCTLEEILAPALALARNARTSRRLVVGGVPAVRLVGSAVLLGHAVLVLLENAMDHAPSGSSIAIDVDRVGGDIVIVVRDRGPGIDSTARELLLRPCGTARATDEAAGLGLPVAATIALQHGGVLTCMSNGHGACFELRLPVMVEPG